MATTTCPQCGETYQMKYRKKRLAEENDDTIGIEQHITGLCSRECYLKHTGSYINSLEDLKSEYEKFDKLFLVVEDVSEDSKSTTIETILNGELNMGDDYVRISEHDGPPQNYTIEEMSKIIENNVAYIEH